MTTHLIFLFKYFLVLFLKKLKFFLKYFFSFLTFSANIFFKCF